MSILLLQVNKLELCCPAELLALSHQCGYPSERPMFRPHLNNYSYIKKERARLVLVFGNSDVEFGMHKKIPELRIRTYGYVYIHVDIYGYVNVYRYLYLKVYLYLTV